MKLRDKYEMRVFGQNHEVGYELSQTEDGSLDISEMAAGKSDKEEFLAQKIEDILGNDNVTDVRISTNQNTDVVGIKFDNGVEVHLNFNRKSETSLEFDHLALSNSGPSKVLSEAPKFHGHDTDPEVFTFCFSLMNTDKGEKFIEQTRRYFETFKDDRVDFS